jgi:hypothetical protein
MIREYHYLGAWDKWKHSGMVIQEICVRDFLNPHETNGVFTHGKH